MDKQKLSSGTVHKIPNDFRKKLAKDQDAVTAWNDITPLARNEFICWIVSPKLPETRANHIDRTVQELKEGKRRPCCWPGCSHREKVDGTF